MGRLKYERELESGRRLSSPIKRATCKVPSSSREVKSSSSQEVRPISRTTLYSLPREVVDMIMGYLTPILSDVVSAKLSCSYFLHAGPTFFELFEPWNYYARQVESEDPKDPKTKHLLCSLCRVRHPENQFDSDMRHVSGLVRVCYLAEKCNPAIELGFSRLTMPLLLFAGEDEDGKPVYTKRIRKRIVACPWMHDWGTYSPNSSWLNLSAASRGTEETLNKLYETLMPGKSCVQGWNMQCASSRAYSNPKDQITICQAIEFSRGGVKLNSWVQLQGLILTDSRLQDFASKRKQIIKNLREWFGRSQVPGGLWICPHIPMADRRFCEEIFRDVRDNIQNCKSKGRYFACDICGTTVGMDNREVIDITMGRDLPLPLVDMGLGLEIKGSSIPCLRFVIAKELGPQSAFTDKMLMRRDGSLLRHLSRRMV